MENILVFHFVFGTYYGKVGGWKIYIFLLCLVEKKNERMKNVVCI
jgi:hypothetical protein